MSTGRTFDWAQVDVFAERPLEGNMLAIFTDATGLSDGEMQALARETNLSETTFILPSTAEEEREHGARVRIFTVDEELPFAGHPTLGTASWLWGNHPTWQGADEIRLRLNVGTVPVRFRKPAHGEIGVHGQMRQRDPQFGAMPGREAVAAACGVRQEDLHPDLPPQVVSTGLPFCVVPLVSLEALQRVQVQGTLAKPLLERIGAKFFYVMTRTGNATWRARMPFKGSDDPATGSAAGCAISYLVHRGTVAPGAPQVIEQGVEVRRPSRIYVQAGNQDGKVTDAFVGGRTIPVATGRFTLR